MKENGRGKIKIEGRKDRKKKKKEIKRDRRQKRYKEKEWKKKDGRFFKKVVKGKMMEGKIRKKKIAWRIKIEKYIMKKKRKTGGVGIEQQTFSLETRKLNPLPHSF